MRFIISIFLFLLPLKDTVPPLNSSIVKFLDKVEGTTVGSGECWDLAAMALDYADAYHDRSSEKTIYVFGKEVDPESNTIYPGDIIQMKNVKLQYNKDNAIYTEHMDHHTAIVYKVNGKGDYEIAHQNTSFSGRKVGRSTLKLEDMKSGKLIFYRPISK
jgi:hypothetical protein